LGDGDEKIDDTLDHLVHQTAEIAGDAPQDNAQDKAQQHADQPDGEGDARADECAAENIPAQPIRAKEHQGWAILLRTKEVDIRLEQPPYFVGFAPAEKLDGNDVVRIFGKLIFEGLLIQFPPIAIIERAFPAILAEKVDTHWGGLLVLFKAPTG